MDGDGSTTEAENGEAAEVIRGVSVNPDDTDQYEKKYYSLLRRCEDIQRNNERLVNRVHHVKKIVRRLRRDRRMLMKRLDQHGDDYHNIPLTISAEDDGPVSSYVKPPYSPPGLLSHTLTSHPMPSVVETSTHQQESSSTSSKKKSRPVEKDARKHANPFYLFCQEQQAPLMEQYMDEHNEEIGQHELTKTLAKNWNSLPPESKKVYYDRFENTQKTSGESSSGK